MDVSWRVVRGQRNIGSVERSVVDELLADAVSVGDLYVHAVVEGEEPGSAMSTR